MILRLLEEEEETRFHGAGAAPVKKRRGGVIGATTQRHYAIPRPLQQETKGATAGSDGGRGEFWSDTKRIEEESREIEKIFQEEANMNQIIYK